MYWYYETVKQIEMLRAKVDSIQDRRINLMAVRRESRESLCYQGGSGQYGSERVQGKKSIYHSPVESAYEASRELSAELYDMWTHILNLERKISRLQGQTDGIRIALSQLSSFEAEIVEYKYRYKMSTRQIGRIKDMHKNTIERQRQRIIEELGKVLAEVG